ncbi:MAG: type I 3-dehydroquinate dehydratase, partial [Spirochaetota bacterium]
EVSVRLIISVHKFGPLPSMEGLRSLLTGLEQLELPEQALFKFAFMVKGSQELERFYRFAHHMKNWAQAAAQDKAASRAYILLAMGEYGDSSRILRAHIGSEWTFCGAAGAVAPGQLSLEELVERYRYRRISENTTIYGVIGNPIAHSRSPEIHNPIYEKYAWDAVYLRFRVDDLRAFLAVREWLPIRGISCTVPHKEALAQMAISGESARAGKAVRLLGAANTLYLRSDGPKSRDWFAENTDIEGFLRPLLELCCRNKRSLAGKKAAVIGAGGAARAVVYALLKEGMLCEIYNRTLGKAERLKELFRRDFPIVKVACLEQGALISADCDLLVQTTSVGMGRDERNPIPAYRFRSGQIAYDLIYEPPQTAFLRSAEQGGAWVLNGSAMLETQALAQIELFADARGTVPLPAGQKT